MTSLSPHCMEVDPQVLPARLRRFLAPVPAKHLALAVPCDLRTAENIKSGHWPIARHWAGLVRAFGRDLTEAVFHPDAAAERLEREVAELEAQLATKRAAARALAGNAPRPAQGVAQVSNRTARLAGEPSL